MVSEIGGLSNVELELDEEVTTKARKDGNTKKYKFRAHAAQAPALRVLNFVFSW